MEDSPAGAGSPQLHRLPGWPPLHLLGYGLLHFLLCRVGDELTASTSEFSTFWPASGLAVAAFALSAPRRWPWLAAATVASELVAGLVFERRLPITLAYAAGDLVEATVAALPLRFALGVPPLGRLRDVLAVLGLGAGLAAACGATVGAGALALYAPDPARAFGQYWGQYWSGDALGILVVASAALAWLGAGRPRLAWSTAAAAEWALTAAVGAAAAWASFHGGVGPGLSRSYLLLPVLGWAAIRFGVRGTTTAGLLVAFFAAWSAAVVTPASAAAAAAGPGPVDMEVQFFLLVTLTSALVLAATQDERERALGAHREAEARFEAFLEHSPAALFILDASGRLVAGGAAFERMMDRTVLSLHGETAAEALAEPDGTEAAREDGHILRSGEPVRIDRRIAGRTHHVVKFRIPRADGHHMVGGVAIDVTEQRLAERALRLAQVALDRAFTAILFVEPGGIVTYANEAARRLLDRPAPELLGRSLWELDGAFDEASWPAAWRRLEAQGSLVLESRLAHPDGRRVDAEVALTLVVFDGQAWGVYSARDLSERRRAESAQRLASIGTLAAGMAHEINNPLTFVAANLAYALDRLGPLRAEPRVEEAGRALEDAEEGTRRVSRVVRDLKSVSRGEGGERRAVDLRAEIETALKLAQHEVRPRATPDVQLDQVPPVEAAEFELGQVFVNLIVNAAHAIPEGDAARHRIRVSSRTSPEGWAVVEVADTGQGIPEAIRSRIFEPFFTTKPVGQGSGLGLSVCHGIVTGLGGRIEVESVEGGGSTFRVLLPPAPPSVPRPAPSVAPAPRPDAPRARILVIDDEPLIGATIRRLLGAHEVVALTDPRAALARLAEGERFDLVLCDLMMPQLSGMDLHAALEQRRPEATRRMVFMTGGAFTDRAREFLGRTAAPQLQKPFAPQDLRDAVRAWLATPPGAPLRPRPTAGEAG
jgi:PAS domain S-box-containing protein